MRMSRGTNLPHREGYFEDFIFRSAYQWCGYTILDSKLVEVPSEQLVEPYDVIHLISIREPVVLRPAKLKSKIPSLSLNIT